jgi:DNA-directed RNA polymerase subunit RPC12/RpoP
MPRERYRYALSVWTVEKRGKNWYFALAATHHERGGWKGPYSSIESVTLMLARQLRREITIRYERQVRGNGVGAGAAPPAADSSTGAERRLAQRIEVPGTPEPRFRNSYRCERCGHEWEDVWSASCDDDCPACGARHMSPYRSEELGVAA